MLTQMVETVVVVVEEEKLNIFQDLLLQHHIR